MSSKTILSEQFPKTIGFSMAPFGYTVTLEKCQDGAYECRGRDNCYGKFWPDEGESLEQFKLRLREHVDVAH
jgi:hypothetical protein